MATASSPQTRPALEPAVREALIHEHRQTRLPRLERLWQYYRNELEARPASPGEGQPRPAQAAGLPDRLRGQAAAARQGTPTRELVIENDIAWRIHTLVDFMFGRPVSLQSQAPDPQRARLIERFLNRAFDQAGGISFFQDLALLGSIYGYVDVLVSLDPTAPRATRDDELDPDALAEHVSLDPIEAPRGIPMLSADDYRKLEAYMIHVRQSAGPAAGQSLLHRVRQRVLGDQSGRRDRIERTELWTADQHERYRASPGALTRGRTLVEREVNRLGRLPVVHIQNLPQPFFYEGLSEVEPLIPLQDELNTRLSDRANRVTFQSFKMYLGKGIDGFTERPVGPGQMWSTDNPDASIQEFGGDGENPSEEAHINEIREAMDKTSAVTPVAAGMLRDRVGNLTSENALRITLMGLKARTEKKRITYGRGIERICEMLLHAADVHGLLPNDPAERHVRLDWPDPLPESESQRLDSAQQKLELGVSRKQVLAELGYDEAATA